MRTFACTMKRSDLQANPTWTPQGKTAMGILFSLSLAHLCNDTFQSVIPAVYPILKDNLALTFAQIGMITLVYQLCASVFQPVFGVVFDKRPSVWYLPLGTLSTAVGLFVLAYAGTFYAILAAVALVGLGSSVLHPEASRLTHFASGGRHGLAQSIFQVGGNLGGSLGPLLAALIIAPYGQRYIVLFGALALATVLLKRPLVRWYGQLIAQGAGRKTVRAAAVSVRFSRGKIAFSISLLLVLVFSKYVYMASLTNFYTFYLMEKFAVTARESQFYLFAFLFSVALGTFLGGPVGDRLGRKFVIWASILGAAPFALLMPHASLVWTCVLSVVIGLVLSSAFSAILVYAQELLPGKLGLVSGFFFGVMFGVAGIAAAVLGEIADAKGIEYVYDICAYMPLLGVVAFLLPDERSGSVKASV